MSFFDRLILFLALLPLHVISVGTVLFVIYLLVSL